jgi:hypothetical protein
MSDQVKIALGVALIGAIQVVVLALIAVWMKRMEYRQKVNYENIQKIEKATNSMKDALVKATGEAAFAAGAKSETDKSKDPPK